jgi:hypothetical protein
LLKHTKALEDIAYKSPRGNRAIGTKGHDDTVKYILDQFRPLGSYYNVTTQPFQVRLQTAGTAAFAINGAKQATGTVGYSPSGNLTGNVVVVENLGCNAVSISKSYRDKHNANDFSLPKTDYPAAVAGNIALISRGWCGLSLKSVLAGKAGAVGAVVYNSVPKSLWEATLDGETVPMGPQIPIAVISKEDGAAIRDLIAKGTGARGQLNVKTVMENITTFVQRLPKVSGHR